MGDDGSPKNANAFFGGAPNASHTRASFKPAPTRSSAIVRELLDRITATLQPRDSLEDIWIRDIVDLVWHTFRLRRAKAGLTTDAAYMEIEVTLSKCYDHAPEIARQWVLGDEAAARQVERALAAAGMSMDRVVARAISFKLKQIERIDRMLTAVEVHRSAALHNLANYRAPLAQKLRRAIAQEEAAALVPAAPRLPAAEPA